jgi:hypothetical protein
VASDSHRKTAEAQLRRATLITLLMSFRPEPKPGDTGPA